MNELFQNAINSESPQNKEAMMIIEEKVHSKSIEFMIDCAHLMTNEMTEYVIKQASSVFLSRCLTANNPRELNLLQEIDKTVENAYSIHDIKEAIISTLYSDNDLLRPNCILMISLFLNIERSYFVDEINQIFALSQEMPKELVKSNDEIDDGKMIALRLLNEIINNPCIRELIEIPEILDSLISMHNTAISILSVPMSDKLLQNERVLASEVLLNSLQTIPSLTSSEELVMKMLSSLEFSFPVDNYNLFSNLHQIMLYILINNYEHRNSFMEIIFNYLMISIEMDNMEYLEIVLTFFVELSQNEASINLQNDETYVSVIIFPNIFQFLVSFIQTGLDQLNPVYKNAVEIIKGVIRLSPVEISENLMNEIETNSSENESIETTFIVLHLLACLGDFYRAPQKFQTDKTKVKDFLLDKLNYIIECIKNPDERIVTSAMYSLGEILRSNRTLLSPFCNKNRIDENEFPYLLISSLPISETSHPHFIKYFLRLISSIFSTFECKERANPLKKYFNQFMEILDNLFTNPTILSTLALTFELSTTVENFIKNIPNEGTKIPNLDGFFTHLCESLKDSLSMLTGENFNYQSLILSTITIFTKKFSKESILLPLYEDFLSVIRGICMHTTVLYADAFPCYSAILNVIELTDERMNEFLETVEFGLSSGEPNVIMQIAVGVKTIVVKNGAFLLPWLQTIFEMLESKLEQADDQCMELAVPFLIRTISEVLLASQIQKTKPEEEEDSEEDHKEEFEIQIIAQNGIVLPPEAEEMSEEFQRNVHDKFVEVIKHFIERTYDNTDFDELSFGNEIAGALFIAFDAYFTIYLQIETTSELKRAQINFIKFVFINFIKNIINLGVITNDTVRDYIRMFEDFVKKDIKYLFSYFMHKKNQDFIALMSNNNSQFKKRFEQLKHCLL